MTVCSCATVPIFTYENKDEIIEEKKVLIVACAQTKPKLLKQFDHKVWAAVSGHVRCMPRQRKHTVAGYLGIILPFANSHTPRQW